MESNEDVPTLETYKYSGYGHICVKLEKQVNTFASSLQGVQLWWTFIRLGRRWSCRWCIRACVTTLRDAGGTCRRLHLKVRVNWKFKVSLFCCVAYWRRPSFGKHWELAGRDSGKGSVWSESDKRHSWAGHTFKDLSYLRPHIFIFDGGVRTWTDAASVCLRERRKPQKVQSCREWAVISSRDTKTNFWRVSGVVGAQCGVQVFSLETVYRPTDP